MITIIVAIVVYLAFHVGAGHTHHRHRKAHGLSPNFYWSSVRGPTPTVGATTQVQGQVCLPNLLGIQVCVGSLIGLSLPAR